MQDIELSRWDGYTPSPNSQGFAAAADFIASDPDQGSFVFRKFNRLAARSLLDMQNELLFLEMQLEEFDTESAKSSDDVLCSAARNYEDFHENVKTHQGLRKRKELQEKIARKLDRYQRTLIQQRGMAKLERPEPLVLKTYAEVVLGAGKNPSKIGGKAVHILNEEYRDDLVILSNPTDRDLMSRLLRRYWPFAGQKIAYHDKARSFEERSLILVVRSCSTVVAALLLIGSILALYFVTDQDARLGLVIAFVVLFAIGLSVYTGATRDSIFAGTAAYAAVLIVFVSGNLSNRKANRLGP